MIIFDTSPKRYRHWKLAVAGPVATLAVAPPERGVNRLPADYEYACLA